VSDHPAEAAQDRGVDSGQCATRLPLARCRLSHLRSGLCSFDEHRLGRRPRCFTESV
jgi:hypothetical protein